MKSLPDHDRARNTISKDSSKVKALSRLSELSPEDKPWDTHGQNSQQLMRWFSEGDDWQQRKSECMESCGRRLVFGVSGEGRHKLKTAQFCRIRLCPRCQWRKSLAWKARWYKAWPEIQKIAPKARYFHLVLTVPNVPVAELRETILKMSKAWNRMVSRKTWPALGFVRATEVEIEEKREGYVHPHFHCLVMVSSSYFNGENYMSADAWRTYWGKALGMDPSTMIKPFIRAVDPKGGVDTVAQAIKEVFKYAVKGITMKPDDDDDSWVPTLLEMDRQLKGTQATSLGGIIREVFRGEEEITEAEMLAHKDEPDFKAEQYWEYVWNFVDRWYQRNRILGAEEVAQLEAKDEQRAERTEKGLLAEQALKVDAVTKSEWDINKVGLELQKLDATPEETKKARSKRAEHRQELQVEVWRLDRQSDGEL